MTIDDILERLRRNGAAEEDLPGVVRSVTEWVLRRSFAVRVSRLSAAQQERWKHFSEEELAQQLKEQPDLLPALTEEELERVTVKTWEDYFASIERP